MPRCSTRRRTRGSSPRCRRAGPSSVPGEDRSTRPPEPSPGTLVISSPTRAAFATSSLRAPVQSASGDPAFDATLVARFEQAGGAAVTAVTSVRVAPVLVVEHVQLGSVSSAAGDADYSSVDAPLDGVEPFDVFRIRFQVRNADLPAADLVPGLQSAASATQDGPRRRPMARSPASRSTSTVSGVPPRRAKEPFLVRPWRRSRRPSCRRTTGTTTPRRRHPGDA